MQTIIRQIYRYEFLCGASCCPSPWQDIVHPERAHLRNVKRVVDNGIFAHSEKTRNKLHNPHVPNPDWWREKQRTERRYVEDAWIPADRYEGMGQVKVATPSFFVCTMIITQSTTYGHRARANREGPQRDSGEIRFQTFSFF